MGTAFTTEDIVISSNSDSGADYDSLYDPLGVPVDLSSGYTAEMMIKVNKTDSTSQLTLTNGAGITLGSDGSVKWRVTAAQGALLPAKMPGLFGVYDIVLTKTADGSKIKFKAGGVSLDQGVST